MAKGERAFLGQAFPLIVIAIAVLVVLFLSLDSQSTVPPSNESVPPTSQPNTTKGERITLPVIMGTVWFGKPLEEEGGVVVGGGTVSIGYGVTHSDSCLFSNATAYMEGNLIVLKMIKRIMGNVCLAVMTHHEWATSVSGLADGNYTARVLLNGETVFEEEIQIVEYNCSWDELYYNGSCVHKTKLTKGQICVASGGRTEWYSCKPGRECFPERHGTHICECPNGTVWKEKKGCISEKYFTDPHYCENNEDCVPEQCCRPTSTVNFKHAPNCSEKQCRAETCFGPLCGNHIECVNNECQILEGVKSTAIPHDYCMFDSDCVLWPCCEHMNMVNRQYAGDCSHVICVPRVEPPPPYVKCINNRCEVA